MKQIKKLNGIKQKTSKYNVLEVFLFSKKSKSNKKLSVEFLAVEFFICTDKLYREKNMRYVMKVFLKNLLLSIIISLILIIIFSVLMSKTNINDNLLNPIIIGIVTFSLLVSAFNMSRCKKEKGIIFGSLLGIAYIVALYLISSFAMLDFSVSINSLIFIILGILGGAIGGIIGVNF